MKRGLVAQPDQWKWSSFRYYAYGEEGLLRTNRQKWKLEIKYRPVTVMGDHTAHPLIRKSREGVGHPARPGVFSGSPLSDGAAYLESRRNPYKSQRSLAPEETELANQIAGLLSGCYAEQRREISAIGQGRLVSLYFLTPKTDVEPFGNKARKIRLAGSTKLLLRGAWPPYNFAEIG